MEIVTTDDTTDHLMIRPATDRSETIQEEGQEALLVEEPTPLPSSSHRSMFFGKKKHVALSPKKSAVKLIEPSVIISSPVANPEPITIDCMAGDAVGSDQQATLLDIEPSNVDNSSKSFLTGSDSNNDSNKSSASSDSTRDITKTSSKESTLSKMDTARELLQQASQDLDIQKTEQAFGFAIVARKTVSEESSELDHILNDAMSKGKSAMQNQDPERAKDILEFVLPDPQTVERLYQDEVSSLGFDKSFEEALRTTSNQLETLSLASLNEILDGPLTPVVSPRNTLSEPPPSSIVNEPQQAAKVRPKAPRLFAKLRFSHSKKATISKTQETPTTIQPTIVVDDGVSTPVVIASHRLETDESGACQEPTFKQPLSPHSTNQTDNNDQEHHDRRREDISKESFPPPTSPTKSIPKPTCQVTTTDARCSPSQKQKTFASPKSLTKPPISTPVIVPFGTGNSRDELLDMDDGILNDQEDEAIPPPPAPEPIAVENESLESVVDSVSYPGSDSSELEPLSSHDSGDSNNVDNEMVYHTEQEDEDDIDPELQPVLSNESAFASDDDDKYTVAGDDEEEDEDSIVFEDRYSIVGSEDDPDAADVANTGDKSSSVKATRSRRVAARIDAKQPRDAPKVRKPLAASKAVRRRRLKLFRRKAPSASGMPAGTAKLSSLTRSPPKRQVRPLNRADSSRRTNDVGTVGAPHHHHPHHSRPTAPQPQLVLAADGLVVRRPHRPLKSILRPPRIGHPPTKDNGQSDVDDENPLLHDHIRRRSRGHEDPQPVDRLQLDP